MWINAKEGTVKVTGGNVTYVVFGSGERPMVLIPGLSLRSVHGSALPLAWMYRLFARDRRVYVFDKKDVLPVGVTVKELAEDTAEAMEALGIADADVIGISQGGMIAQYLALGHPGLVGSLALGVTLCRTNDTVRRAIELWTGMAERGDYGAIVKDMTVRMYSPGYIKRWGWLFPVLLRTVKLTDPERFTTLARSCLTCDTCNELDRISCPVLVLGGELDRIVNPEASVEIAERTGGTLYMYEELGHSAYEEAKDFNKRIYDFLRDSGRL